MNGLLIVNLGTPDAPDTKSVRRYLAEFLSDPYVVDINPVGRWLLLNLIILPRRPQASAEAYQQIWDERGSPLLYHSQDLTDGVREALGADWHVELAMRYGQPDLASALDRLAAAKVDRLVVLPLYPQYAYSSSASTEARLAELLAGRDELPEPHIVGAFYDDAGYLDALTERVRASIEGGVDHVLFSFHGVPERQVRKTDPTGSHCLASEGCCDTAVPANERCYRFHSFETARAVARRLELPDDHWSISFQSRLGRTPWLTPYTDFVIPELAEKGVKRLAVVSASFIADCLETLEELGIRGRDQFLAHGGDELVLVPAVNSSPAFVEAATELARRALAEA